MRKHAHTRPPKGNFKIQTHHVTGHYRSRFELCLQEPAIDMSTPPDGEQSLRKRLKQDLRSLFSSKSRASSRSSRNLDAPDARPTNTSVPSTSTSAPLSVSPAHSTSRAHLGSEAVIVNPPSTVPGLTGIGELVRSVRRVSIKSSTLLVDHGSDIDASVLTTSPPLLDNVQANPTSYTVLGGTYQILLYRPGSKSPPKVPAPTSNMPMPTLMSTSPLVVEDGESLPSGGPPLIADQTRSGEQIRSMHAISKA